MYISAVTTVRVRLIAPAILLLIVISVSCSSPNEATPTPESQIDITLRSYIGDLTVLKDALVAFGNPDGPGGSIDDVRQATSKLVTYAGFFATLTDERRTYMNEKYGVELSSVLQQVTNRAIGAVEISGNSEITGMIQQIPGLAASSSETSR